MRQVKSVTRQYLTASCSPRPEPIHTSQAPVRVTWGSPLECSQRDRKHLERPDQASGEDARSCNARSRVKAGGFGGGDDGGSAGLSRYCDPTFGTGFGGATTVVTTAEPSGLNSAPSVATTYIFTTGLIHALQLFSVSLRAFQGGPQVTLTGACEVWMGSGRGDRTQTMDVWCPLRSVAFEQPPSHTRPPTTSDGGAAGKAGGDER